MERQKRNDDELRAASDHLYYEIEMLKGTMERLKTGPEDGVVSNALIESFAIHARILMDFLYPLKTAKETDVLAEDFFVDRKSWEDIRGAESAVVQATRVRVNKEIAHLTYNRQEVAPERKKWEFVDLGGEILKIVKKFEAGVPKRFLGPRWERAKNPHIATPFVTPPVGDGPFKTDVSTPGNLYR